MTATRIEPDLAAPPGPGPDQPAGGPGADLVRRARRHGPALLLFAALTLVMTWPLVLHLGGRVPSDLGDPLYNIWVMSWNRHAALNGLPLADTNILHPHRGTLFYADPIFGLSLANAALRLVSPNDVLCYNILFLLSFLLAAGGMYALVLHLSGGRRGPAALAGLAFAFFPYRFAHISHLELLYFGWIPLAFLFLHRFFERRGWPDLLGFFACYALQALSCAYYAVFLTLFAGAFIAFEAIRRRAFRKPDFWVKMGAFAALSMAVLGPAFFPYVPIHRRLLFTHGLAETLHYSADLANYVAVPSRNLLYGWWLGTGNRQEWQLFPGLTLLALAGAGWLLRRKDRAPAAAPKARRRRFLVWDIVNAAFITGIYWIVEAGGFTWRVGGAKILTIHDYRNPLLLLGLSLGLRIALDGELRRRWRDTVRGIPAGEKDGGTAAPRPEGFYLFTAAAALLLSLGPMIRVGGHALVQGPLDLFLHLFPDFRGVRVPGRFGMILVFALAVLGGLGLAALERRFASARRPRVAGLALGAIMLLEYATLPVPLAPVPAGERAPAVYRDVAALPESAVLIELPMAKTEADRAQAAVAMYHSTRHWRRLVNGYSGYFPPSYDAIRETMEFFPSRESFTLLRNLGVSHVLVHTRGYRAAEGRDMVQRLRAAPWPAVPLAVREGDYLYRFEFPPPPPGSRLAPELTRIEDKSAWTAAAAKNGNLAPLAIDGDRLTRWSTYVPQEAGDEFELDLGEVRRLGRIDYYLYPEPRQYPRGFVLRGSADGRTWRVLRDRPFFFPELRGEAIEDYPAYKVEVSFPPAEVRFVRMTLTRAHPRNWSISEIECWESPPDRGGLPVPGTAPGQSK